MPRLFVPWSWVQQIHLNRSRQLATLIEQRLAQIQGLDAKGPIEAPVRQLRSVDAPAVAIEIGTLSPSADAQGLTDARFQAQLGDAVAQALAGFRGED